MLEEKLKDVKLKVAALGMSVVGVFAAPGCGSTYSQSFLTAHHITCCDTVECGEGGTCRNDEIDYRDGEPYVTCSCHYPQTHAHDSSSSQSWSNEHGYGMGDRNDRGGTHRECSH